MVQMEAPSTPECQEGVPSQGGEWVEKNRVVHHVQVKQYQWLFKWVCLIETSPVGNSELSDTHSKIPNLNTGLVPVDVNRLVCSYNYALLSKEIYTPFNTTNSWTTKILVTLLSNVKYSWGHCHWHHKQGKSSMWTSPSWTGSGTVSAPEPFPMFLDRHHLVDLKSHLSVLRLL